jgi:hypothetical protein
VGDNGGEGSLVAVKDCGGDSGGRCIVGVVAAVELVGLVGLEAVGLVGLRGRGSWLLVRRPKDGDMSLANICENATRRNLYDGLGIGGDCDRGMMFGSSLGEVFT